MLPSAFKIHLACTLDEVAMVRSFIKPLIKEDPVLALLDPLQTFILDSDANNVGFSAVKSQEGEHGKQVIAYFTLSDDNSPAVCSSV